MSDLIKRLRDAAETGKPECWNMLATSELFEAASRIEQLESQLADADIFIRAQLRIAELESQLARAHMDLMDARLAAQPAQESAKVLVSAELITEIQKLTQWKHCMSYNDSYFSEPAGLVKNVTYQLDRLLPTDAASQPTRMPPKSWRR